MNFSGAETYDFDLDIPLVPEEKVVPVQADTYASTVFDDMFDDEAPAENLPIEREPQGEAERKHITPWPAKLPLDLALGAESPEQTLLRHNVKIEDYTRWTGMIAFRRALADAAKDVHEQGLTFKLQCSGIAQDFLEVIDQHLHDERTGFGAKMDAFKTITKLAGLEPKDASKETGTGAGLVNIQINL